MTLAAAAVAGAREQARARLPDAEGHVERDGVRIFYEVHGHGEPTVVLLPTWSIIHSRHWKAQVADLARHCRVVCFDGRGNGRSDRPRGVAAYAATEFAADTLAVMDATSTERAVLVGLSCGALWATRLAADHPERVVSVAYIAPAVPLGPGLAERAVVARFDDELDEHEGWARYNRHAWRRDYAGFLEFFFGRMFSEPHCTKQIEDCVGWGLETDPETLADTACAMQLESPEPFEDLCGRVGCPVLVLHGDRDGIRPHAQGEALARLTGGELVTLAGSGHGPHARDPVRVNLLLREFIAPGRPRERRWIRGAARPPRALFVSSPIGLGHARRDLAIARELRRLRPGLQIEWLAQHPVTAVLEAEGEVIHPAGGQLASESAHMQAESDGHELHCFRAWRRMDEILAANFMVFHDVARDGAYDLWIGDEAWEVDHHLHENPELKTAAYAWLTDFVGWLPVEDEEPLTADYNAEMLEQVERYPRVRDRALFLGTPDDIVPGRFGPGLPEIRAWTERHFDFPGYVSDVVPLAAGARRELRADLGYGPQERICLVTVGGSGVGAELLRRVVAAFPAARERVSGLRMVVVAGPRIDPACVPAVPGVEVHGYVHDLHRHLAACDLALVQGGLASTMELVAHGRPFLCFPLRHHFEQQLHVRHRLERHGARRFLDAAQVEPDDLAAAIAEELGRPIRYRDVPRGGAARAAAAIAELL